MTEKERSEFVQKDIDDMRVRKTNKVEIALTILKMGSVFTMLVALYVNFKGLLSNMVTDWHRYFLIGSFILFVVMFFLVIYSDSYQDTGEENVDRLKERELK